MNTFAIPTKLNVTIAIAAMTAAIACLWVASHAVHWSILLLAALMFSLVNNTVFSLLHECVHGSFHPNARINRLAGMVFAAMFPTGFLIQQISHFGHHRRNRTDLELFDYYLPGKSRWLKTYWLYCLLTGFYWSIIPVAGLLYLLVPWAFSSRVIQQGPARWWGFEPMVRDIGRHRKWPIWLEVFYTAGFQISLFWFLDLNWIAWLCCYWAFAINWSALQYVDHAWSKRDVIEGAWNLQVHPITQAFFLNYHCHLEHHRRPNVPWLYLPRLVAAGSEMRSFWSIYWLLWRGAQPAPAGPSPQPLVQLQDDDLTLTSASK